MENLEETDLEEQHATVLILEKKRSPPMSSSEGVLIASLAKSPSSETTLHSPCSSHGSTLDFNNSESDLSEEEAPHELSSKRQEAVLSKLCNNPREAVLHEGRSVALRERKPWLVDFDMGMKGYHEDCQRIALFDSSIIAGDKYVRSLCTSDRDQFYIDLFFQMQFFNTKKKRTTSPSAGELLQGWNSFVMNYLKNPDAWIGRLQDARARFENYTLTGAKMLIHRLSSEDCAPCAVRKEYDCSMCYDDAPMLPDSVRSWDDPKYRYHLSENLRAKLKELDRRYESATVDRKRCSTTPAALIHRSNPFATSGSRSTLQPTSSESRSPEECMNQSIVRSDLQAEKRARLQLERTVSDMRFELATLQASYQTLTNDVRELLGECARKGIHRGRKRTFGSD